MRKTLFWFGWFLVALLPILYAIQIAIVQDLPAIEPWKWSAFGAACLLVVFSRNRDDVLKHHVV